MTHLIVIPFQDKFLLSVAPDIKVVLDGPITLAGFDLDGITYHDLELDPHAALMGLSRAPESVKAAVEMLPAIEGYLQQTFDVEE
ncbi:hypothetical protein KKF84_03650 [Myxococcota bacterium]|nr:hypothetical protein [Myxococcota bacterium]